MSFDPSDAARREAINARLRKSNSMGFFESELEHQDKLRRESAARLAQTFEPPETPRRRWDVAVLTFSAGLAVGAILCAAAAALALEAPSHLRPDITLAGPAGDCFDRARIVNRAGYYNGPVTLATIHGPVTITYRTVGGHKPGADDEFEALDWPDAVSVWPVAGTIPDGETLDVCLSVGVGG